MGNAGEARLDVVALGRDEVTVLMNKVSGELDALKGKLAGYEKANRSAASGSDAATASMGKFSQIAADASKKIGNIGSAIIGGAIGGMGAGVIGALVDLGRTLVSGAVDFLTWTAAGDASARATKVWEQHQKEFSSAIERTQQLLNKTTGGPLEQQLSDVNVALSVAKNLIADMEKGTEEWRKKSAEIERLTVAQKDLQRNMAEDSAKTASNWERVKRAMSEAAALDVPLFGPFTGNADDLGLHHDLAGTAYTDAQWEARQKKIKEAADKARAGMNRGGGSRPSRQSNPYDSPFQTRDLTGLPSGFEAISGGPDPLEDITYEMMPELATGTEKAAAAFDKLAKSMGAIDEKLPGLSGAFADISEIWEKTGSSAKDVGGAVIGSVDAIATAGAAWFKDEKARTRFLGAKELLLAAPLWFIDPAQAAVKTATGLGLLALAGGGGGGGGGGGARGAGGGGNASSGGGGPTTIINNFSMGIGDRQTITTALRQSARTSAGTGQSSRSGV